VDDALAWAADNGVVPVGEVTQPRTALWSTTLRIPTRDGVVWLKQNGPGTSYEAGLVKALVEMGAPHLEARHIPRAARRHVPVAGDLDGIILGGHRVDDRLSGNRGGKARIPLSSISVKSSGPTGRQSVTVSITAGSALSPAPATCRW